MKRRTARKTKYLIDLAEMSKKYESIKANYLAQGHILAIREAPAEAFLLTDEEMLSRCGIEGCAPLKYGSSSLEINAPGNQNIGGRMLAVSTAKGTSAVIIIRDDYPSRYSPPEVAVSKIALLYHELGHAHDLNKGINFKHSTKECPTKDAEDFAKRKLKQVKCEKIVDGRRHPSNLWEWYSETRQKRAFKETN